MRNQKSNSQFRSHSLNLFSIKFFSTAATFLVVYFYSHHLAESDYGRYQGIWTQLAFLNAFAGVGLASMVFTYTPVQLIHLVRSISGRRYAKIALIPLACGVTFSVMQALQGQVFYVFLLFFLFYTANNIMETTLAALHQFRWLPTISLLYAVVFFGVHYYAVPTYNVDQLFVLLLPVLTVRFVIYVVLLWSTVKNKNLDVADEPLSLAKVKSLWLHLYFFEASQILISYLDKFVLSNFLSEAQFALYFNATISIPFLNLVFSSVATASMMQLSREKDVSRLITVLHQMGRVLATVAFPCFFFFVFFSREIFTFFFSEKYLPGIPIFICTLFVLPLRAYSYTALLQINHKGSVINKGVVLDVVVAMLLFIPLFYLFGLKGVTLAFIVGTYIQAGYYLVQSGKMLNVRPLQLVPLRNWILKFLFFGVGVFGVSFFLKMYLSDIFVLVSGCLIVGSASLILLLREFKTKPV